MVLASGATLLFVGDGGKRCGRNKVGRFAVFDARLREKGTGFAVQATQSHATILSVDIHADGVAAGADG